MASRTYVENAETVYRRIRNDQQEYHVMDGRLRFSLLAFRDPQREPSVDRAKLCGKNPAYSIKNHPDDGVIALAVEDIRNIEIPVFDGKRRPIGTLSTDVEHRPSKRGNNPAHSVIKSVPASGSNSFRRLQESLAQLASKGDFLILPANERNKGH